MRMECGRQGSIHATSAGVLLTNAVRSFMPELCSIDDVAPTAHNVGIVSRRAGLAQLNSQSDNPTAVALPRSLPRMALAEPLPMALSDSWTWTESLYLLSIERVPAGPAKRPVRLTRCICSRQMINHSLKG
jgi:hypothetical protein